jgi:hypothetical protein
VAQAVFTAAVPCMRAQPSTLVKTRMYVIRFYLNISSAAIPICIRANSMQSIKLTTTNPNKYGAHTPQSNLRAPPQGKCCNPRQPPISTSKSCTCSFATEYQYQAAVSIADFDREFESASNDTTSNSFTQHTPMERFKLESNNVQPALLAFNHTNGRPCLNITPALRHEFE